MVVAAVDANGDGAVDFNEWFNKLKSYVTIAFEVLDENQDGSILEEAKDGNILDSISYSFFEKLIDQVFDFFDSNKDEAISLEDDFFLSFGLRDRDEDGEIDLSEALGTSLISLPAPVYNFYTKVGCFFPSLLFTIVDCFDNFSWTETPTRDCPNLKPWTSSTRSSA